MARGQRVVVEDVAASLIFKGTPALDVMLAAGARAVQSTPLVSSAGHLLGMISTHWARPHRPSAQSLKRLDLLARQAADFLERIATDRALRQAHELLADRARQMESLVQQRTARLQEALGELEAFSYSVAHDLRAPLRAMSGYAQAILHDSGNSGFSPQTTIYLERIQRAAARLDRLTQEVLSYSKLSRGDLCLEPVDLNTLSRQIVEQYPQLACHRDRIQICSPLAPVIGHEGLLTQALSNLLINACKFVAPGAAPKVVLWTATDGDKVRLGRG
jgi:signal transduction histidine kinase